MRNSKYGTTVQKYLNLYVKNENNDYNRHFRPFLIKKTSVLIKKTIIIVIFVRF